MVQSPVFVTAGKRPVEVEQALERKGKETVEGERFGKRMYKFQVSSSCPGGFAFLSLFLSKLHTREEYVRDKKENEAKKRQPF